MTRSCTLQARTKFASLHDIKQAEKFQLTGMADQVTGYTLCDTSLTADMFCHLIVTTCKISSRIPGFTICHLEVHHCFNY